LPKAIWAKRSEAFYPLLYDRAEGEARSEATKRSAPEAAIK